MLLIFLFFDYFKMNFKNGLMVFTSAALPIIIVLVIFFSPYNFSYLLKQSRENFRDETEELESKKCDPEKEHPVDFPVKNKGCTKRGRDLLTVQEFMDGESLGCYKGKAFY